ncbi:MAG: c-type cytochrome [Rhodospirillales bacterium]|nr:c-type cytochrome [Rhodospirillales bacterium]
MTLNQLLKAAWGGLTLIIAMAGEATALDGKAIFAEKCASCHNVTGPAPTTLQGVLQRKAPDLFYAGSKFKREWLVRWIQSPTPIRPSGVMFLNHLVTKDGKDSINKETVKLCSSKLSAPDAEAVADYLTTLKDSKMRVGVVDRGKKFSTSRAVQLFTKQYPCIGCHTVKIRNKEAGGVSGPPLTDAGDRLNPDWVYARIENPQYWDPKTWMPKIDLSHEKRETLTLFVVSPK